MNDEVWKILIETVTAVFTAVLIIAWLNGLIIVLILSVNDLVHKSHLQLQNQKNHDKS